MAKTGTLTVKVVGDASGFKRTMDDVGGGLTKVASIGKTAALGLGAVGVGAAALGQEVLNTGAKLTAWRQKTATVFEESAGDVKAWADKNNEIFGLTDDELAGLAAGFGDLLKPMGFTSKQAADMSKKVIGLSGALSEWSGGQRTAAEVSDILAKAMLGEREGLKELGISISEADVQARLLAKGQNELTGSALEQAKALATQELIFEKSTDAQKAYAEGGNQALRAQNELKAGLGELREQLADKLLPVVTQVTQWLADHLPAAMDKVGKFAAWFKEHVWPIISDVAGWIVGAFQSISDWVEDNWPTMQRIIDGVANFLAFTVWPKLQSFIGWLTVAFIVLRDTVEELWDDIASEIDKVAVFLRDEVLPKLVTFYTTMYTGFIAIASAAIIMRTQVSIALGWLKSFLEPIVDLIDKLIGRIGGLSGALETLSRTSGFGVDVPKSIDVGGVGGVIGTVFKGAGTKIPLPGFDKGGIVGGARGSAQVVLAHGGETILPTHKSGNSLDTLVAELRALRSDVRNMQLVVDGRVIGDVVRNEGSMYALRNG